MYRRTKSAIERQRRKLAAMRHGRERAALACEPQGRIPDLPELRRVVIVTDHDSGQPVTHRFELLRSRRVDSYRVMIDGQPWRCCGWSAVCEALRRSHQRLPSPRSDAWA